MKIAKVIFFILSFALLINLNVCFAQEGSGNSGCSGGTCKLENPLPGVNSPEALIGKVIKAIMGIVGSIALVMFIYGGFVWMMAGGNAQAVDKGKSILMWAAVGLIVIFSSYALVQFVFKDFLGVTS